MAGPFDGGFGGGGFSGGFAGSRRRRSSSGLSYQQMLKLAKAQELLQKGEGRSFWDKVKGGAGGLLHDALNVIMRPSWAVTTFAEEAGFGSDKSFDIGDFGKALSEFKSPKNRFAFGELMKREGILEDHDILRGIAGFGADVLTDPTTYLTFGAGGVAKSALSRKALEQSAKWNPRAALARTQDELFASEEQKFHVSDLLAAGQSGVEESARKKLRVSFGVPKASIGFDTPIKLPSLRATAEGEGLLGRVPFNPFGKAADAVGRKFRPDWQSPAAHGAEINAYHKSRRFGDEYFKAIDNALSPYAGMKLEEKHQALHFAETADGRVLEKAVEPRVRELKDGTHRVYFPDGTRRDFKKASTAKGAITKWRNANLDLADGISAPVLLDENRQIIDEVLESSGLSDVQKRYVRDWHEQAENLRLRDEELGVPYDKGKMPKGVYVPHPYTTAGDSLAPGAALRGHMTKGGFQFEREGQGSISDLMNMYAKRDELSRSRAIDLDVEFDPTKLLLSRARRGAEKQADYLLQETIRRAEGVPLKTANFEQIAKAGERLAKASSKLEGRLIDDEGNVVDEAKSSFMAEVTQKEYERLRALRRNDGFIKTREKRIEQFKNKRNKDRARAEIDARETQLREIAEQRANKVFDKRFEQELKKNPTWIAQREKAIADIERHQTSLANPEAKALGGNFRDMGVALPFEMQKVLANRARLMEDDEELRRFRRASRKWLGKWKTLVTVVNPGYAVRNTASDLWGMYISGMPTRTWIPYTAKAANIMRQAAKGDAKAKAIVDEAKDRGVMSGLFYGDVLEYAANTNKGGGYGALLSVKNKQLHPFSAAAKAGGDFNRERENMVRLAHYLYRRQSEKLSPEDAARRVLAAHFDYEDLTSFEKNVMKSAFPFYTWTRKNIPFQAKQMASQPGKYAAFPKAVYEAEAAAGESEGDLLPDFMRNQMAFKVPGLGYSIPAIGATDLLKIPGAGGDWKQQWLGMTNPAFKLAWAAGTGLNPQTGEPIAGKHPRNPIAIPGWTVPIANAFGVDVGPTERKIGNKQVDGQGAAPWFSFLMGQSPVTNALFNQRSSIREKQRGNPWWLSYGLGTTAFDQDQQTLEFINQLTFDELIAKVLRGLRDEDLKPEPDKKSESEFEREINKILKKAYGRRTAA